MRIGFSSQSVRNFFVSRRAAGLKLLQGAMALVALLASTASAQVVEGYIQLPDSFGVFPAPYRVAWDFTPGAERLFIGGDSSDIIVIDAVNLGKLARIPTGPVGSLCFSPAHNKLYASLRSGNSLYVIDCNTYQISKQVQLGGYASGLYYNPVVDRVYCSGSPMKVLDCSNDSIVGSLSAGTGCTAFDSTHNKLYVGGGSVVKVIDCYSDSVVAAIPRVAFARVLCYNSASDRVYAAANESLYAIDATSDTVVHQSPCSPWLHTLRCDPARNRIYGASLLGVTAWDCALDTCLWGRTFTSDSAEGPKGLACVPDLDRVYVVLPRSVPAFEGSTGDPESSVPVDGRAAPPVYVNRLNRLYCFANWGQLAAIDCGIDTAAGQIPLDAFVDGSAEQVCLDTVMNKLYFAFNMPCGYVGAADCSAKQVTSYQMCRLPGDIVHDARDGKLYVSTWNGLDSGWVSVFDCRSDSLIKVIPTGHVQGGLRWHPVLNKVYAGATDSLGRNYIVVIDCVTDSITRILDKNNRSGPIMSSLLSPAQNQFWGFSSYYSTQGYTVVDCVKDSIVLDTVMGEWTQKGACVSEENSKVFVVRGCYPREIAVLSMKSFRPVKSVPLCLGEPEEVLSVPAAGKFYVAAITQMSTSDSIFAVDTRTDSVVSRFAAGPHIITAMCDDATGRYVYCIALQTGGPYVSSETLLVIDTQCDSIVSGASLSGVTVGAGQWLLPNRRTGRIYAGQGPDGRLLVIRDSVVLGVEELRSGASAPAVVQTVVSRAAPFRSTTSATLFDASGRRAAILRSGPNDIGHLAPGVYYVREAQAQAQAVRKVILTE
jgi:DNA-binding beta-propeller fold protein YncE